MSRIGGSWAKTRSGQSREGGARRFNEQSWVDAVRGRAEQRIAWLPVASGRVNVQVRAACWLLQLLSIAKTNVPILAQIGSDG